MKKKTNLEFKSEVLQLVGNSFIPLTKYENSKIKIAFYHVDCGQIFYMSPNSFLRGQRCPKCGVISRTIKQTLTQEQFDQRIEKVNHGRYRILSKYVQADLRLSVRCLNCDRIFYPTGHNLMNGAGCPFCNHSITIPEDEFEKRVREKNNGQFEFLNSYQGTDTKIKCRCKKCGFTWKITPHAFYRIKGCPMCQTNHAYTTEEFKQKLLRERGADYILVGEYKVQDKLKFKHLKCGRIFYARSADMLVNNTGCPFCNMSKGEEIIAFLLRHKKINFIRQQKFDKCKYKRKLPFDFYLPQLRLVIEYDGSQHFQANHFGRTPKSFKIAKLRDNIKTWYCQSHNLYLIRIPYTAKTKSEIAQYLYML